MKVKITKRSGHPVYGENGMYGKLKYGFEKLGHEVVEEGEDLLIVPGSSSEISKDSNSIWWSHGVNWARGFENEDNAVLKNNFDNCRYVAYQSKFAKHMVEKAFGKKNGPIVLNASINMLPGRYIDWDGGEVRLACCSIWRAWKRLHEIERMVRTLASKGHRIHLDVIGKDPKDNCPFELPKEGQNYKIEYLGLMDIHKMKEIYWNSHVGVHLAFNDYSPASVTEMMSCGLPVIVTNSGGSKDALPSKVIDTDPFVDTSFSIHSEGALPKVDEMKFEVALMEIMNNLYIRQLQNQNTVTRWVNSTESALKLLEHAGL